MLSECPECGMPVDSTTIICPKCDCSISSILLDELWVVDVAHDGEDWVLAREKIDSALNSAFLNKCKGLKVIHGHGIDSGHTGIIRKKAVPYLKELGRKHDSRLVSDRSNPGAHIIYFN